MQKYSALLIFLGLFSLAELQCTSVKKVTKGEIEKIINRPSSQWTVEDCNTIIDFSSCSNTGGYWSNDMAMKFSGNDVFIRAVRLSIPSIEAMAAKEAILKRLSKEEYTANLKYLLEEYTNHTYNIEKDSIERKIIHEDSLKGMSFKVYFQNATDPYRPIDVEEGYEYFFLENYKGEFSRIREISGDYAENHFFLADYLNVTITFSRFTDDGIEIFDDDTFLEGYKLVFNALQDDPIVIEWKHVFQK